MTSPPTIKIDSLAASAGRARGAVVIIDVFRAFTTAAVALANGAEAIVMVEDLDTALALRARGVGRICIGERRGVKPMGFDFGNSPHEIRDVSFAGDVLIQTTSNGTKGVLAARDATRLYACLDVDSIALAVRVDPSDGLCVARGERA